MMNRSLVLGLFGLALAMFVSTASAKDKVAKGDATHSGTVVSAAAGKLVMTGKDNKEHSHEVASAKITLDGKAAKLEDLKKGMTVTVTSDKNGKVTAISATSAKPKAKTTADATPKPAISKKSK